LFCTGSVAKAHSSIAYLLNRQILEKILPPFGVIEWFPQERAPAGKIRPSRLYSKSREVIALQILVQGKECRQGRIRCNP